DHDISLNINPLCDSLLYDLNRFGDFAPGDFAQINPSFQTYLRNKSTSIQSCYLTPQRLPLKWWQITPKYAVTPISILLDHGILPQGLHSTADSAPVHPECVCNLIDRHRLLALA